MTAALSSPIFQPSAERRRSARHRLTLPMTAEHLDTLVGLFWCEDLSAGGARLSHGQSFRPGDELRLTVHFPWRQSIAIDGSVVHHGPESGFLSSVGVSFARDDTDARRRLARSLEARLSTPENGQPGAALVVIADPDIRRALLRDLKRLGVRVTVVTRPLELVWQLSSRLESYSTVFVDHGLLGERVAEWLHNFRDEFPGLRRALVSDRAAVPGAEDLLSEKDLHALVTVPWNPRYIEEIVRPVPPTALL